MASARAHASTSDPQHQQKQQPGNCGATSVGHASLVSFARSASARNLPSTQDRHQIPAPQFGRPSNMGAATSATAPAPQAAPGVDGSRASSTTEEFERASAAMRAMNIPPKRNASVDDENAGSNVNVNRSPRVGSVPKRMREPMTVDTLTGMLHEMPCPSGASGDTAAFTASTEPNVFGGENCMPSSSDAQKRRRTITSTTTNTIDADTVPPPTIDTTNNTDDAMTDDLCFLVDQVALKADVEKEQKFMPYIV